MECFHDLQLHLQLCGIEVDGSPFVLEEGSASAEHSSLRDDPRSGTAIAGVRWEACLISRDPRGVCLAFGGAKIRAHFLSPKKVTVPVVVQDTKDGTYKLNATLTEAGAHSLQVEIGGKPVCGSPFVLDVNASEPFPEACEVRHFPREFPAFFPTEFLLHLQDRYGNLVIDASARVAVDVGKNKAVVQTQFKDGDWILTVLPLVIDGEMILSVQVNDRPVGLSPLKARLSAAKAFQTFRIKDPTPSDSAWAVRSGQPLAVTFACDTQVGQHLDIEQLKLCLEAPSGKFQRLPAKYAANSWSYEVTFDTFESGVHTLCLHAYHLQIPNTILQVESIGPPCGRACEAWGEGLFRAARQSPAKFQLRARDSNKYPLKSGGALVRVEMLTPSGSTRKTVQVSDMHDGTNEVSYMLAEAGVHQMRVWLGEEELGQSPFEVVVSPGKLHARSCRLTGAGLQQMAAFMTSELCLHLQDQAGNAVEQGAEVVQIEVERGKAEHSLVPEGRSRYKIRLKPLVVKATLMVRILIDGELATGAPLSIEVYPNTRLRL